MVAAAVAAWVSRGRPLHCRLGVLSFYLLLRAAFPEPRATVPANYRDIAIDFSRFYDVTPILPVLYIIKRSFDIPSD